MLDISKSIILEAKWAADSLGLEIHVDVIPYIHVISGWTPLSYNRNCIISGYNSYFTDKGSSDHKCSSILSIKYLWLSRIKVYFKKIFREWIILITLSNGRILLICKSQYTEAYVTILLLQWLSCISYQVGNRKFEPF